MHSRCAAGAVLYIFHAKRLDCTQNIGHFSSLSPPVPPLGEGDKGCQSSHRRARQRHRVVTALLTSQLQADLHSHGIRRATGTSRMQSAQQQLLPLLRQLPCTGAASCAGPGLSAQVRALSTAIAQPFWSRWPAAECSPSDAAAPGSREPTGDAGGWPNAAASLEHRRWMAVPKKKASARLVTEARRRCLCTVGSDFFGPLLGIRAPEGDAQSAPVHPPRAGDRKVQVGPRHRFAPALRCFCGRRVHSGDRGH